MFTLSSHQCLVVIAALCCAGCTNEGKAPPRSELYFPIDLAIIGEAGAEQLLIANANFDLQYRGGTLLSLDLGRLDEALAACGEGCIFDDIAAVQSGFVEIGSQASDLAISTDRDMAYLSVRSDVNITSVQISPDGSLSCGAQADPRCDEVHRRVDEQEAFERGLDFAREPVAVEVLPDPSGTGRDYLVVVHRSGRLSLLRENELLGAPPVLLDVYDDLPSGLSEGGFDDKSQLFWFGQRAGQEIVRVGISGRDSGSDVRFFRAQSVFLRGLNEGEDVRDLRFDDVTGDVYVLLGDPQSLAIVRPDPDQLGGLESRAVIPVGSGPSRIELVQVGDGPDTERWLLVSCFGSRELYIIDPIDGQIIDIERGFSGPFAIASDEQGRVYVADFRASVVRILSLNELAACRAQGGADAQPCRPGDVGIVGYPNIVDELL